MRAISVFAVVIFGVVLTGCTSRASLPPLPSIDTSRFLTAVREPIDTALKEARAKPNDPATNGRLAMLLHANDQFAAARLCYQRASNLEPDRFEWIYYLGAAELADGKPAEAVRTFRRTLALRPRWIPAKLKLAQALLDSAQTVEAKKVLDGILSAERNDATANFLYARVTGDPVYYERAIKRFPQYGAALFALAQHYQRSGRPEDAARLMSQYARFRTTWPPVDDPLMNAIQALKTGPADLLRQAETLESQGQLSKAAELNEEALRADPELTQAHINLISAYARLGDAAKAEAHYRMAISQNANAADAYYNYGVLCYTSNRKPEAQRAFERTLSIDPGKAEAHANLGVLHEEQGRLSEAAAAFRKAIELRPDNRVARFHLGRIYANERRYSEAIAEFSHIVTPEDESTPTYLYAMGATYARAGRKDEAVATLGRARAKALEQGQGSVAAAIERDLGRLTR